MDEEARGEAPEQGKRWETKQVTHFSHKLMSMIQVAPTGAHNKKGGQAGVGGTWLVKKKGETQNPRWRMHQGPGSKVGRTVSCSSGGEGPRGQFTRPLSP